MRLPTFIVIFACLVNCPICSGQSEGHFFPTNDPVYSLSLKKDIPIATVATGLTLSYFLMKKDQNLSLEYIMSLDHESINEFDESAIQNSSYKADKASDIFLFTAMASPILLMADPKIRKDWKEVTVIGAETYLIGMGLVALSKNLINRPRPSAYNTNLSLEERAELGTRNSFVSGHTASTAMATFMMAKIITDYHPDTKLKPLIWTVASGVPLMTGMLRYKAGKHYFTDIMAGYAVGALTGYFVPHIHKKVKSKINSRNAEIIELFDYDSVMSIH